VLGCYVFKYLKCFYKSEGTMDIYVSFDGYVL